MCGGNVLLFYNDQDMEIAFDGNVYNIMIYVNNINVYTYTQTSDNLIAPTILLFKD